MKRLRKRQISNSLSNHESGTVYSLIHNPNLPQKPCIILLLMQSLHKNINSKANSAQTRSNLCVFTSVKLFVINKHQSISWRRLGMVFGFTGTGSVLNLRLEVGLGIASKNNRLIDSEALGIESH